MWGPQTRWSMTICRARCCLRMTNITAGTTGILEKKCPSNLSVVPVKNLKMTSLAGSQFRTLPYSDTANMPHIHGQNILNTVTGRWRGRRGER